MPAREAFTTSDGSSILTASRWVSLAGSRMEFRHGFGMWIWNTTVVEISLKDLLTNEGLVGFFDVKLVSSDVALSWDRWIPLIRREICELFISAEEAPLHQLVEKLDAAQVTFDGPDFETLNVVKERDERSD